jgi:hypothetical protein
VSRRRGAWPLGAVVLRGTDVVAYRNPRTDEVTCTACVPSDRYGLGLWECVLRSERQRVGGRSCDGGCGRVLIPAPADPPAARAARRRVHPHAEEAA